MNWSGPGRRSCGSAGKRGVFLTLDAVIAIITMMTFVGIIMAAVHSYDIPLTGRYLLASQTLASAQGSGVLVAGVSNDSMLTMHLDRVLPSGLCGKISISNDTAPVMVAYKTGCIGQSPAERWVAVRSFIAEEPMLAKIEVWQDE